MIPDGIAFWFSLSNAWLVERCSLNRKLGIPCPKIAKRNELVDHWVAYLRWSTQMVETCSWWCIFMESFQISCKRLECAAVSPKRTNSTHPAESDCGPTVYFPNGSRDLAPAPLRSLS
jgi:hypothetical protein